MWKNRYILPGELARQDPRLLVEMLYEDDEPELPPADRMTDYQRMFYGY